MNRYTAQHYWTLPPDAGFTWWFRCILPVSSTIWNQCSWGGNSRWITCYSHGRSQEKSKISNKDKESLAGGVAFQEKWEPDSAHGLPQALDELIQMCWKSNECGVNTPAQFHKKNTAVYWENMTKIILHTKAKQTVQLPHIFYVYLNCLYKLFQLLN